MDQKVTDEKILASMDLTAAMTAEEIAIRQGISESEALAALLSSDTGMYLYMDEMKYWWLGPSDIAELYLEEKNLIIRTPGGFTMTKN